MYKFITILLITTLLFSCDNDTAKQPAQTDQSTTAPAPKTAPAQVQLKPALPSLSQEMALHLFKNCDYIDYVFYSTNFSISQKEKASIQGAIAHIAQESPQGLNPNCKAMGRVFYQIDGENVAEADFYFQDGCHYLVFLEKGKPAYSNLLTQPGIDYFNNIFNQIKQGSGGQQ